MKNEYIVALDAGHGINTAGKRCTIEPYKDVREWELNKDIVNHVYNILMHDVDIKTRVKNATEKKVSCIITSDTIGAVDVSLSKRCVTANDADADLFISVHHNAANALSACGTNVYYYYPSYNPAMRAKRQNQAYDLYREVTSRTGLIGNRAQKTICKDFYVLKHTKMPAFLLENGFMTSPHDCPIINTHRHAVDTARGICDFIVDFLVKGE